MTDPADEVQKAVRIGRVTAKQPLRFPDVQCFRGPSGIGFRAYQAAKRVGTTKSEFIRVAVEERIGRVMRGRQPYG